MKAKRKAATKSKRGPGKAAPSDARLIKECVIYAQMIAAFHAGFNADPDGDNKYATGIGDRHMNRASNALAKIATMVASTPGGLQAKARILPMVIEDSEGGLEDVEIAFCVSFALDVRVFLDPIIHEEWVAAKGEAATVQS